MGEIRFKSKVYIEDTNVLNSIEYYDFIIVLLIR